MGTQEAQVSAGRRALIKGVAGAASSALLLDAALAGEAPPRAATLRGTSTPTVNAAHLFRKLRFRADDGLIFWWLQGPKYGQVGTVLTPLYTMLAGTIQRVVQRTDGGFDLTSLEMVFFADPKTGERLTTWRNPYTGESIPVKFDPLGPRKYRYSADNTRELPKEIGGARMEATASISDPLIVGDHVFIREDSTARVYSPGRSTPFEVNDLATYHGSLSNLVNPAVKMGDATVSYAEVTRWQRWMRMGEREGNLTSRSSGAKVANFEEMPGNWRAMLAEVAPQIAANPAAALDAPEARFDR